MPKIMKIGWQLTKLLQKLSGLLFWPTLYITATNTSFVLRTISTVHESTIRTNSPMLLTTNMTNCRTNGRQADAQLFGSQSPQYIGWDGQ